MSEVSEGAGSDLQYELDEADHQQIMGPVSEVLDRPLGAGTSSQVPVAAAAGWGRPGSNNYPGPPSTHGRDGTYDPTLLLTDGASPEEIREADRVVTTGGIDDLRRVGPTTAAKQLAQKPPRR